MPVFATGTPLAIRKAEAARTLGGQINSLTFIDRAAPRPEFGADYPFGRLLEAATNSLMFAGNSKRTIPRFQIGSRSGREYQQQIALSGGEGTLNLVFNPALELHRELMAPPLDSSYLIRSIMAPPYMNMVAGQYEHLRSGAVTLDPENQATMEVTMLDNFGARYVPARLYQSGAFTTSSTFVSVTFNPVPNANENLIVGKESGGNNILWSDSSGGDLHVDFNATGAIELGQITGGADLETGTGQDTVIIIHIPGETGGYIISSNLSNTDFSASGGVDLSTGETDIAGRVIANPNRAMYLGVYSIDEDTLLFR